MTPTIEELAKRLGLGPPVYSGARASGRTTTMLLGALQALVEGQSVAIWGYGVRYSKELAQRLSGWADELGLEGYEIESISPSVEEVALRGRRLRVFRDHYPGVP